MKKNFLLNSKKAKKLYEFSSNLPIIDYHNHLSLEDIKENKRFFDVYELWIKPDPYKHRAMRMCGISEYYITGDAPYKDKFLKWCETVPKLIGNALYHWSIMELEAIFPIKDIPNKENAEKIYEICNKFLENNIVSVKTILQKFNVYYACPCASLVDDISYFEDNLTFSPSLRGDDIVNPSKNFLEKLSELTDIKINCLKDFENAIENRLIYFKNCGCVFTDHALDNEFKYFCDDGENETRFKTQLNNELTTEEKAKLTSYLLTYLGTLYSKYNLVMQLHIGAERYTSTVLRNKVGPAGGFATIGNSVNVSSLTKFLDILDLSDYGLPKTVLFTLNPSDNALISVLAGSYSKDGEKALITQGPAWWWCDHKLGIENMLENTSAFSVLSNFLGMTTDSRSFLSFVRHDYFRRILCNWIADKINNGDFICNENEIKQLILNLSSNNAKEIIKR